MCYFHPENGGNDPIWRSFLSDGLKETTNPLGYAFIQDSSQHQDDELLPRKLTCNMNPKNDALEEEFPFEVVPFQGIC